MNIKFRLLLVILMVGFSCVGTSAAQTRSTLPTEAEAALARGMAAVRSEQWDIAVRYFTEAQSLAPESPGIMFNLGLAVDRAGGRELAALGWYGAYLASMPEASNAEQVRSRMFDLEIQIEVNADRLLTAARQIAAEVINSELSADLLAEVVRAESDEAIALTPPQDIDFYWDIEPANSELSGPQGPAAFLISFAQQQSATRSILALSTTDKGQTWSRASMPDPIDAAAPFDTFVDRLQSLQPDEMVGTAVCGARYLMSGLTLFRRIERGSPITVGGFHLCFRPPTGMIDTVLVDELMWTIRDNGSPLTWNEATEYCEALTLGGYTDWRLPTIEELEEMFDRSRDYPNPGSSPVHIKSPIELADCCPWSSTRRDSDTAWTFNFSNVAGFRLPGVVRSAHRPALCVLEFPR